MSIRELWEARREGRFGLKHYLMAWLISARMFGLPWCCLYCLFGALLAGVRDWLVALGGIATVALVLLASHFRNNYRDVELGIDRYVEDVGEAEKVVSTIKPYTAAAWLVPLRITSVRFQKVSEYLMLGLSVVAYYFLVNPLARPETVPFYLIGVLLAEAYTDVFKVRRLGEVAAFLGHGFSTVAFGYLTQSPDVLMAVLAGVPAGLISALAYSVDQFVDIKTDFVERVRTIYEAWFNSRMPLGLYVIVIIAFYMNVLTAWVATGIYPPGTLVALAIVPAVLYRAPALEWERDRALRDLAFIVTVALPALMCVGVAI